MILRRVNEIDFKLLHSGKICFDELQRIRRIARQDCIKLPHFLRDIVSYRKTLNQIAVTNGLVQIIGRPLSFRKPSRPRVNKKTTRGRSENRTHSRLYSCPARSKDRLPFTNPRTQRILYRRSSTCQRLCTSVASFKPVSGDGNENVNRKGWV